MTRPRFARTITVLALLGMAISAVSVKNHYSTEDTGYCSFGESFDCDLVNRSIYSKLFGIPVAGIGLIGYALLLVLAWLRHRPLRWLLFAAATAGLAFSLYLTYLEAYVLVVWCILCIISLVLISLITLFAAAGLGRRSASSA